MLGLLGQTISHYSILEKIGQGGMSSVFRAVDLRSQLPVAVKVLSPYIAHEPRFRARFAREIRLLGRLKHPNIMPILDFGEAQGLAFIVMPYLGSGTLSDRLLQGPMDAKDGSRIIRQLASALAAAHAAGVIHRDVKPSNVLLDRSGNALLSDFSFAHQTDASVNLTGSALIGTPAYMSPEQCRGEPIDERSDQYALAVVLFQMTTGKLPFEGDTPMATALKHVNEPLPRPRQVNPSIPDEVEMVLVKALAKDPALRFGSVLEFNNAFQEALRISLDPARAIKTRDTTRSTASYNRLQNVKPAPRRRWFERSALAAAMLLLVACPASAAAMATFYPGLLTGGADKASGDAQATFVQERVEILLTLNAPAAGTALPPGVLETAVYAAVIQTLASEGTAVGSQDVTAFALGGNGEVSATPWPFSLVFPTPSPTTTWTVAPGKSPMASTATPSPTGTSASGATPTSGSTGATPTSGSTGAMSLTEVASSPTATQAASATPAPPTSTGAPTDVPTPPEPTATPVPPTATSVPPSATSPGPDSECGHGIPPGHCRQTQTAAAGG